MPSAMIPANQNVCDVTFPNFSWHSQVVLYRHDTVTRDYNSTEISPYFRGKDFIHNVHKIVLASSFFGYIGVRIINTDNLWEEKLFLIKEGDIFTFQLVQEFFYALAYVSIDGERKIHTNMKSDIFSYELIEDTFYVKNTLLDTVVFFKEIPPTTKRETIKNIDNTIGLYNVSLIEDPIIGGNIDFITNLIKFWEVDIKYCFLYGVFSLEMKNCNAWDIFRFIGFLGKYVCILHASEPWFPWYLTKKEATDSIFKLPESFSVSKDVTLFDPRWQELRMWLLELTYMWYNLESHIHYLEKGIQEINHLEESMIEFQKIHMNITLDDARKIYPLYVKQKDLLIKFIKDSIS